MAESDAGMEVHSMNRRHFLMSTAVMAGGAAIRGLARARTKPSGWRSSAAAAAARSHVNAWSRHAERRDRRRSATSTSRTSANKLKLLESQGPEEADDLRRLPQAARGQEHRRGLDRHAESLAHADDRSGRARPARTSTSRSRARTTCSSRSRSSPPRASTTASCSRAARADRPPALQEAVQR